MTKAKTERLAKSTTDIQSQRLINKKKHSLIFVFTEFYTCPWRFWNKIRSLWVRPLYLIIYCSLCLSPSILLVFLCVIVRVTTNIVAKIFSHRNRDCYTVSCYETEQAITGWDLDSFQLWVIFELLECSSTLFLSDLQLINVICPLWIIINIVGRGIICYVCPTMKHVTLIGFLTISEVLWIILALNSRIGKQGDASSHIFDKNRN